MFGLPARVLFWDGRVYSSLVTVVSVVNFLNMIFAFLCAFSDYCLRCRLLTGFESEVGRACWRGHIMTRCLHVALHALLISLAADSISSGCISAPLHPIFLGEGRPSQFRPINMEMEVCFLICIRHYASGPVCPNPFALHKARWPCMNLSIWPEAAVRCSTSTTDVSTCSVPPPLDPLISLDRPSSSSRGGLSFSVFLLGLWIESSPGGAEKLYPNNWPRSVLEAVEGDGSWGCALDLLLVDWLESGSEEAVDEHRTRPSWQGSRVRKNSVHSGGRGG